MRKYIRYHLRVVAQKAHAKPSKYVNMGWDHIQNNKVGDRVRSINKAKGTHPKRTWRQRIQAVVG